MSKRYPRWGGPCIYDERGRCTECGDLVAWALDAEPTPADDIDSDAACTHAQLADAVDEAHAALHEAEQSMDLSGASGWAAMFDIRRAHDALHRVGAGMPRVSAKKGV